MTFRVFYAKFMMIFRSGLPANHNSSIAPPKQVRIRTLRHRG
jgi:hypothetical protein